MKIAIIAPTEIPARRANTLQVMKMAQALVVLGHTVRMAVPSSGAIRSAEKPPDTADRDLPIGGCSWKQLAHHYGLQHEFAVEWLVSTPSLRRYDYSWRALLWADGWQADLVYTRLPQAAALASQRGMTTILETHDVPQGKLGPWLFQLFLSGKGARKLVIITQALASDLAQRFGRPLAAPFTVIAPDGVDLERYEGLPQSVEARRLLMERTQSTASSSFRQLSAERFTVGYTGHLYPGRGRELLLELAKRMPQVAFLVVGGESRDISSFQAEIQAQQVQNLILTGFVPNAELPLFQAACDVLLMPYQQKVAASSGGDIARYLSPMKLFEYLACQRPIVSSDLEVLQEVLNPQNAILAPANDPVAWERAIQSLRSDPELRNRLASQARRDAQCYTWERRARRILEDLK